MNPILQNTEDPSLEKRHVFTPTVLTRSLTGRLGWLTSTLTAGLSLYALYWVVAIVQPQIYRISFLLITLVLIFLLYPATRANRERVTLLDWLLVFLSICALAWPLIDFENFVYRAATPSVTDLTLGFIAISLVLEATRRTVGWILPVTAVTFLAYAYCGPVLEFVGLRLFAHRGYSLTRLVGTLYITLEGIFGVPLDVAATYIILFAIFGAVLQQSGAGQFFIDWTMATMGKSRSRAGPARAVTMSGFLLGTVSGSGVATTVTLGAIAWPLLRRAGYTPEAGGAILSASGIGSILAPPTMGAAAFLIAEFLKISYLQVVVMAIIPALLYYLSIFLLIEAESRRMGIRETDIEVPPLWPLTRRFGYQFLPLFMIIVLLVTGQTAFTAVFYATLLAIILSFLQYENALWPRRLYSALEIGARRILSVTATTATAGIIVGVVTLTGLGFKIANIIVTLAGSNLLLTVIYSAVSVWMLGLAVPVTASYIIAAVMIAPALTLVGVPDIAAHMFIFYYAVLSEVSPPTALSPFAAAAITGANPFQTMMLTWKYTLPAFLVPFIFTLNPTGLGLLLQAPLIDELQTTLTAAVGIAALAVGLGGWLQREVTTRERIIVTASGLLLCHATTPTDLIGASMFAAVGLRHFLQNNQ